LEPSLRELGTDYVDFYLLNDHVAGDHSSDELVAFLGQAVKAGKIRYFGLGTSIDNKAAHFQEGVAILEVELRASVAMIAVHIAEA
jgi:aryl-alcohol dehydrogenase-like predicted oxidoreductase